MINGRFYFRLTESGNLIGEFSNQRSGRNQSESADVIGTPGGDFTGRYISTWTERNSPERMSLIISPLENLDNLFSLEWTVGGTTRFFGEGFVVNGMLVGNYWDTALDVELRRLNGVRM